MLKISIPTPCHENWDNMTSKDNGRHCNACMKTVVDFTTMTDEEVQQFLVNKQSEHLCGRFKSTQLQRIEISLPQNIYYISMPLWKRFLVACLIVFSTTLFSCEVNHQGKVENTRLQGVLELPNIPVTDSVFNAITDTTIPVPQVVYPETPLMGDIAYIPDSIEIGKPVVEPIIPGIIVGEPAIIPADTIPAIPENRTIKGEMLFVPDSNKSNNPNSECPAAVIL